MRRKPGTLIPIEQAILSAALTLAQRGEPKFHGFAIAALLADEQEGVNRLRSYGTLYRALERLERAELLESNWEDAAIALECGRPRRKLYALTTEGVRALGRSPSPTQRNVRRARTQEA